MVWDKKVLCIITLSKNIYKNENYTGNVTLVKGDGKDMNDHRKMSFR